MSKGDSKRKKRKTKKRLYFIDANSLQLLVSCLLPFDKDGFLRDKIRFLLNNGPLHLLPIVYDETRFKGRDALLKGIDPFPMPPHIDIGDAKVLVTDAWINEEIKKKLSPEEYVQQYNNYLTKSADFHLITTCHILNEHYPDLEHLIVTEESRKQNDGKLFKKMPRICEDMGIKHMKLVDFLLEIGIEGRFCEGEMGCR